MSTDITVVLTVYRRPHTLIEQLEAIQNQTVSPVSILIWKNQYDNIEIPSIPDHLKKNVDIIISTRNFGVWARFSVGLLANTKYIAVFDDDTIPGKKWFENCLNSMNIREGLYGTIGLIFLSEEYWDFKRIGWDESNKCNNNEIHQVDIVGHAWFFKREWLCDLWSFSPDYSKLLTHGEDIAFSTFLQKKNIPTLVPPHPKGQWELFGSHPQKAWKYGVESVGISLQPDSHNKFSEILTYFISVHGFKLLLSQERLQLCFNNIYENNLWGNNESKSGLGSSLNYTINIRNYLTKFISDNKINNILDTSCGEWNWMKLIKENLVNYTGIDIVKKIVDINNTQYSNNNIKFIHDDFLNFIKTQTNKSFDLIICRHTLEHLSTIYNLEFINECKRVCKYLFITGYNDLTKLNVDIFPNKKIPYRPINLKLEPYSTVLNNYYFNEFYDGPTDVYCPEAIMNIYKF